MAPRLGHWVMILSLGTGLASQGLARDVATTGYDEPTPASPLRVEILEAAQPGHIGKKAEQHSAKPLHVAQRPGKRVEAPSVEAEDAADEAVAAEDEPVADDVAEDAVEDPAASDDGQAGLDDEHAVDTTDDGVELVQDAIPAARSRSSTGDPGRRRKLCESRCLAVVELAGRNHRPRPVRQWRARRRLAALVSAAKLRC